MVYAVVKIQDPMWTVWLPKYWLKGDFLKRNQ